jgi:hypothetical protein
MTRPPKSLEKLPHLWQFGYGVASGWDPVELRTMLSFGLVWYNFAVII